MSKLEAFPTTEAAARAAAGAIVAQLTPPGPKRIVVTGGSSPGPVFDRLAATDLGWGRVTVTLSDDRFVAPTSPDSNERLVRERLLKGHAAAAPFVRLKGDGATPADDARAAEPAIRALTPFDAVLLGMGPEGHIASLFAANADTDQWLAPDCERSVVGVSSAGWSPFIPRITLTGRALFDAKLILLLVSGDDKRALIEQILADPVFSPPAAALLRQTRSPVRVLWSPAAA
jgi:6-phosphogluconolactonase